MRAARRWALAALAAGAATSATSSPAAPRPRSRAVHDPVSAVRGLLSRVLGAQYATAFQLEVIPADPAGDVIELDFNATTSAPIIRANDGATMAAGLGWYLKYTVNASWGWGRNNTGHQMSTVPAPGALPPPAGGASRTVAQAKYRYSYNVCTYGWVAQERRRSGALVAKQRVGVWGAVGL